MATPPSAPIITLAPRASNLTLEIQWSAPTSSGSGPITGYAIEFIGPGGGVALSAGVDGNTFYYKNPVLNPLTNGLLYTITIKASNDNGSTYGPIATFRPFAPGSGVPGAPATASAAYSSEDYTNAIVSWTPPSNAGSLNSPIFWYVITSPQDNSIKRTANGLTQSSLQITGLNPLTNYTFNVRAVNCPGYGPAKSTAISSSVLYSTSSDYLTLSSGITVGTSDFSLDFYFKINSSLGTSAQITPILGSSTFAANALSVGLLYNAGTGPYYQIQVSQSFGGTNYGLQFNPFNADTWYYVAIAKVSGNLTGWLGAVTGGSANRQTTGILADTNNYSDATRNVLQYNKLSGTNGTTNNIQITNLRFQLGGTPLFNPSNTTISIPSSPFTPLTANANTQLLLLSRTAGTYITNSATSGITLTANGTPTWSSQSPF